MTSCCSTPSALHLLLSVVVIPDLLGCSPPPPPGVCRRSESHAGDPEMRNQVAQEKFGKSFDELDPMQKIQVGGTIGGRSGHAEEKS